MMFACSDFSIEANYVVCCQSAFHINVCMYQYAINLSPFTSSSVWTLTRGGRNFYWSASRIRPSTSESRVASPSTAGSCGWMTGRGRSVGGTIFPDTPEGSQRNRWVQTVDINKDGVFTSSHCTKYPGYEHVFLTCLEEAVKIHKKTRTLYINICHCW